MAIFSLLGYYIIQCHDICASVNKRLGGYLYFSINPSPHTPFPTPPMLHVKFRQIPLISFRGEVENVSANQRPGAYCSSDQPEKYKLGRGR